MFSKININIRDRTRFLRSILFRALINSTILLIVLTLALQGCKEKNVNGSSVISIETSFNDLLKNTQEIRYIDSAFQYIPLETQEQCYLGKIDKMRVQGNKIFLNDKTNKSLFCFDTNGKFLFKISALGKGPGEYLGIYDFDVSDKYIILLDPNGYKLLMYDLAGNFVKEKKIRHTALRAICIYKHNIYVYSYSIPKQNEEMTKNGLVVYDYDFKALKRIEVADLSYLSSHTRIPDYFIKKGDDLLFTKSYDQTIYRVTDDGLQPHLEMNFLRVPEEIQTLRQLFKNKQAVFCAGRINAVNDSLLFMQFGHNGKRYEMLYNDKQHEISTYDNTSTYNSNRVKADNMLYLTQSPIRCSVDNIFYTLCEVGQIKTKLHMINAGNKNKGNNQELISLSREIDKIDKLQNPVVFCNAYY